MTDSTQTAPERIDVSLLAIRLMVGGGLIFHGILKVLPGAMDGFIAYNTSLGIPLPALGSYLATFAEIGGGLAIATGVLSRISGVPVVFTMLVAGLVAHTGFNIETGGGEYALTLAVIVAALSWSGPGRLTAWRFFGSSAAVSKLARL